MNEPAKPQKSRKRACLIAAILMLVLTVVAASGFYWYMDEKLISGPRRVREKLLAYHGWPAVCPKVAPLFSLPDGRIRKSKWPAEIAAFRPEYGNASSNEVSFVMAEGVRLQFFPFPKDKSRVQKVKLRTVGETFDLYDAVPEAP